VRHVTIYARYTVTQSGASRAAEARRRAHVRCVAARAPGPTEHALGPKVDTHTAGDAGRRKSSSAVHPKGVPLSRAAAAIQAPTGEGPSAGQLAPHACTANALSMRSSVGLQTPTRPHSQHPWASEVCVTPARPPQLHPPRGLVARVHVCDDPSRRHHVPQKLPHAVALRA
jgi:hypothetical protein